MIYRLVTMFNGIVRINNFEYPRHWKRCLTIFPIFLVSLVLPGKKTFSQDTLLTFQEAVEVALKNNFDIQRAVNVSQQSENNNTVGNAGMLPQIDVAGSYSRSSSSLDQRYTTGNEVKRDASSSTSTVGEINAGWTIFDGWKMFHTKSMLSELSMQSRDLMKVQMENTISELATNYFALVRLNQLQKSMQEEIVFSNERVKLAKRKLANGSGSKLELLQAQTELNRQLSEQIKLQSTSDEYRIALNRLLGRSIDIVFQVEDSIGYNYNPSWEELSSTSFEKNNLLNYYRRNQKIAELGVGESRSLRSPVINLNANYIYSKNTSEAGFVLYNKTNGFNYGVTAIMPLFRGFTINRQIKNAKIESKNAMLTYESSLQDHKAGLHDAWREFRNSLEVLRLEEENINFAKELYSIAQERFRIGAGNNLELMDAQRTFEDAMNRLADARYSAKVSEVQLKKLNGDLVK